MEELLSEMMLNYKKNVDQQKNFKELWSEKT